MMKLVPVVSLAHFWLVHQDSRLWFVNPAEISFDVELSNLQMEFSSTEYKMLIYAQPHKAYHKRPTLQKQVRQICTLAYLLLWQETKPQFRMQILKPTIILFKMDFITKW